MGALATGAIAAAVLVPSASSTANVIAAGHLNIAVNHGRGKTLDFVDLAPGESRVGDQLLTGDLAGVRTAYLMLTLSGVRASPFARMASLTVLSGDPEPASSVRFIGGVCTPSGGYVHETYYPTVMSLTVPQQVSIGALGEGADAVCVRFRVSLDSSADNSVEGTSSGFALSYTLTQSLTETPRETP